MPTKTTSRTKKNIVRPILFEQYKSIAEDIESRLNPKFEAIDSRFNAVETKIDSFMRESDAKFNLVETKIESLKNELKTEIKSIKWFIAVFMTLILAMFSVVLKFLVK